MSTPEDRFNQGIADRVAEMPRSGALPNQLQGMDRRRGVVTPSHAEVSSLNVQPTPRGRHLEYSIDRAPVTGAQDVTVVRTPRAGNFYCTVAVRQSSGKGKLWPKPCKNKT